MIRQVRTIASGSTVTIEVVINGRDNTSAAVKSAQANVRGLDSVSKTASKSVAAIGTSASKGFGTAASSAKGLQNSLTAVSNTSKSIGRTRIEQVLTASDRITPKLNSIMSVGKSIAGKGWNVSVGIVDKVTSPLRNLTRRLTSPLARLGITIGGAMAVGSAISSYAGFEKAMSTVEAVSGASASEKSALTEQAKSLGATTKFTANEVAEGYTYMGMAGWKANQMEAGIGGIINLAAASNSDLGTTSDIVTDGLTAFKMAASESNRFADVLAQAATNSNTTVAGMGETFKYAAPIAGAMGYNIEDTAVAIGLMANAGIKGTQAGTALRSMMTRMASPTKQVQAAMDKIGLSITNADGSMRDFSDVMVDMRKGFQQLSETEQAATAKALAGQYGLSGLLAIVGASDEDFNKLTTAINNSSGAAQRMADTQLDNVAGKWTLFKSALEGVQIAFGERLRPYLMDGIQWLTDKMPGLTDAINRGMDRVDQFSANLKEKIGAITGTDEWQYADFFGKLKIGWDKLIAEPFTEWWEGGGKQKIATKFGDIGRSLGSAISTGLLMLLGIDVSSALNDGASIGAQFAKGFSAGFDGSAVVGGIFKGIGNLFTGQFSGGIGGIVSALLLNKIIGGGLQLARGAAGLGGKYAGIGNVLGSFSASRGASGLFGFLGQSSYLLGSGASTYLGSVLTGAAGVGGGILGISGLIGGYKDFKRGANAENDQMRKAYNTSGVARIGGTLSGAAAGAVIGSIIPVIGTAIGALAGAGIGAVAGGKFGKNNIEETQNYLNKAQYAVKGTTFATKELNEAFKDSSVSGEKFGEMLQTAINEENAKAFGNIALSMEEIQDAASHILGARPELEAYNSAVSDAETSWSNLASATNDMAKLNWKAGLGMINSEETVAEYRTGVNNLIASANLAMENEHYQVTAAVNTLLSPEDSEEIISGINTYYEGVQQDLDSATQELETKLELALEDGKIDADEAGILAAAQEKITEITQAISSAKMEASMAALEVKFDGAALDSSSYANLVMELNSQAQEAAQGYGDAFETAVAGLKLQLNKGQITQEQFNSQFAQLKQGYTAQLGTITAQVEGFELQSIDSAFGDALAKAGFEGNVQEKFSQVLNEGLANGVDWGSLDLPTIEDMFGLSDLNLDAETKATIAQDLQEAALGLQNIWDEAGLADGLQEAIKKGFEGSGEEGDTGIGSTVADSVQTSLESADFTGSADVLQTKLADALTEGLESEEGDASALTEGLETSLTSSIEGMDMSGIGETLNGKIAESLTAVDTSGGEGGSGLAEGIQASIMSAVESIDLSEIGTQITTAITESLAGVTMETSGLTEGLGSSLSTSILASMAQAQSAINQLYSQVGAAVNSAFAVGFQTTTTVTITVNYRLANPTATISFSGGGTGTATVSASVHANGGFVNGPELSWVGEDGPEAIIPLGSKRRGRGLDLFKQVAGILGVPMHADGGIVGSLSGDNYGSSMTEAILEMPGLNMMDSGKHSATVNEDEAFEYGTRSGDTSGNGTVEISMGGINLHIHVDGQTDPDELIAIIKANIASIGEDIAGDMAERLAEVFGNMPAIRGGN